jgi:hypothetical protein
VPPKHAHCDSATCTSVCCCGAALQGFDALHHFARHGLDTTPKLVHCLPATGVMQAAGTAATDNTSKQEPAADAVRDTQGPHDLTVVPRTQLPASYFTLSATGVVEVGQVATGPHLIGRSRQQQCSMQSRGLQNNAVSKLGLLQDIWGDCTIAAVRITH